MHASDFKTEVNEEAFQILFDVMEKHFAALKILDSDTDYKLTRAISFSELPSTRRICVEQSYQSGDSSGLIRQYSCEQIFDKNSGTKQLKVSEVVRSGNDERKKIWRTTVPCFDSIKTPDQHPHKSNNVIQAPKLIPNKVEYMEVEDIDSAKQPAFPLYSASMNREIPYGDRQPEKVADKVKEVNVTKGEGSIAYEDIKKKIRPLVPKTETTVKKKRSMCCCCNLLFFLLLPVVILIIAMLNSDEFNANLCNRRSDFVNASIELQEKIYGQTKAIRNLVYYLDQDNSYLKIICLVGGTGVGKSYTTEIIRKNFPYKNNIHVYFPPLKDSINSKALSSKSSTLVILENLGKNDMTDLVNLFKTLKHFEESCVTVLAIFNMEHINNDLTRTVDLTQNVNAIVTPFGEENITATVIPYQPLSEEALEMCIRDAAKDSNLKLTEEQIHRIQLSLLLSNNGCKGAYAKVQVIGRE